jgi:hypothetical protein
MDEAEQTGIMIYPQNPEAIAEQSPVSGVYVVDRESPRVSSAAAHVDNAERETTRVFELGSLSRLVDLTRTRPCALHVGFMAPIPLTRASSPPVTVPEPPPESSRRTEYVHRVVFGVLMMAIGALIALASIA